MSLPIERRIARERWRGGLLEAVLVAAWTFVLVLVFDQSDQLAAMFAAEGELSGHGTGIRGLDPVAQWATVALQHPVFFLGGGLLGVGLAVNAIAGELEHGSLALAVSRPVSRLRWIGAYVAVIAAGSVLIGLAYAAACLVAVAVLDPPGAVDPVGVILAGLLGALLLLSFAGLALLVSAITGDRGRALGWSLGLLVVAYVVNYLLPLWGVAEDAARLTPFGWFVPARLVAYGEVPWGDVAVLALFALVPGAIASAWFARRDL